MKKILIFILLIGFSITVSAQEKPIRIGLKIGVPNIIGVNLEYVTPLFDGKFAPTADFSKISFTIDNVTMDYSYFEIGTNYYFTKQGQGLYGHASYGRINVKGTYDDDTHGVGKSELPLSLVNLKLGAKLGKAFYFRAELGYGLVLSGIEKVTVTYASYTEDVDLPSVIGGGPIVNLGFGFSF